MTRQHNPTGQDATLLPNGTEPETRCSPEDFKAVFRTHPAGVAVVTLPGPDGPVGFTVTSVSSVSADPAVLVFSLTAGSSSRRAIERARSVTVNFLAEDQREIAETFARRGIDRFAQVQWETLPTGEPALHGAAAWVRGEVDHLIPVGDSLLITVRATLSRHREGSRPLVYVDGTYHRLGDHTRTS
jgi:flavin reductase (DIM6/NTAB) family NADH-FMN oxidoreductase RutF